MNAVLTYVSESDERLSLRLRGWRPPRWFRAWMLAATRLGDGWLWLCPGAALLAGGYHRVLAAAAVAAVASNITIVLLKRRFRRQRPGAYSATHLFAIGGPKLLTFDNFSFPSGHALNAFAICTLIGLSFPVLVPLLCVLAASVAASRLMLGLHFLSDVVAGSLLGALIGGAVYFLVLG